MCTDATAKATRPAITLPFVLIDFNGSVNAFLNDLFLICLGTAPKAQNPANVAAPDVVPYHNAFADAFVASPYRPCAWRMAADSVAGAAGFDGGDGGVSGAGAVV